MALGTFRIDMLFFQHPHNVITRYRDSAQTTREDRSNSPPTRRKKRFFLPQHTNRNIDITHTIIATCVCLVKSFATYDLSRSLNLLRPVLCPEPTKKSQLCYQNIHSQCPLSSLSFLPTTISFLASATSSTSVSPGAPPIEMKLFLHHIYDWK